MERAASIAGGGERGEEEEEEDLFQGKVESETERGVVAVEE